MLYNTIIAVIFILAIVLNICLGLLVLVKSRERKEARILFSLLLFGIAFWYFTHLMGDYVYNDIVFLDKFYFWANLMLVVPAIIPSLLLIGCWLMINTGIVWRWKYLWVFLPSLVTIASIPTDLDWKYPSGINLTSIQPGTEITEMLFDPGLFYVFFSIHFIVFLAFSIGLLIVASLKDSSKKRAQYLFIAIAIILGGGIGIVTNAILPLIVLENQALYTFSELG